MADEAGLTRIALRIPNELYERLDKKRFEEGTTFQAVGIGLFEKWLEGDIKPKCPPDDSIVAKLKDFRSTAPERQKKALETNIETFWENEQTRKRKALRAGHSTAQGHS